MTCPNRPHGEYDYCEECDGHRPPLPLPLRRPPLPTVDRAAALAWAQDWRGIGVGDVCAACGGAGSRMYSSTATWHGGMGGQALTRGICDQCWGSGDAAKPWANLRTLREDQQRQAAAHAVDLLARASGAKFQSVRPQVQALVEALGELADAADCARKPRPGRDQFFVSLVRSLREVIARAMS